jgi:hypothetical protein
VPRNLKIINRHFHFRPVYVGQLPFCVPRGLNRLELLLLYFEQDTSNNYHSQATNSEQRNNSSSLGRKIPVLK